MSKIMSFLKEKKIRLSPLLAVPIIVCASFAITYIMFGLAPGVLSDFKVILQENHMLYFLNYLPILLFLLLCYFITNNAVFSVSFSAILFFSCSIINRVKIQMRQDPFLPTDVSLVTEITSLLDKFNASFYQTVLLIAAGAVLAIVVSLCFFGGKPFPWKIRGPLCLAVLLAAVLANQVYYKDGRLYDSFPINGNYYFKVNHYEAKGFLYSFLREFNTRHVVKPAGYHKNEYDALEQAFEIPDYDANKKPHIIMIMGEAFTDLSENSALDFTGYQDPMQHYKEIASEDNSINGHIVVPNFGGGTSDTEFDALTACPTTFIENTLPSYSFVRTTLDSIPLRLKKIGYDTLAIHPGYSWFYNRKNVYEYMGFDDFLYLEDDFDLAKQNIAGYISEEATIDKIISTFEEHQAVSDAPLFSFCVTIQNHGPYTDKYGIQKSFDTSLPATDAEINMLSNYFRGMEDADRELSRLVDYFRGSEEPVVVVYFGDHLPGFPDGLELFHSLDYPIDIEGDIEERLNLYKTPFLIWQNDSAKELFDFQETAKDVLLPEELTINASSLGALAMELIGYQGLSPLFDFTNDLRKQLPVVSQQGCMDSNSHYTEEIPENLTEQVQFLRGWVYYKLFDERLETNIN